MQKLWMTACVFAFAAACGGGIGDKAVSELTADELVELCEDTAAILGEPRTVSCDGIDVELTPPDCSDAANEAFPAGCKITVDQYLACSEAVAADPCSVLGESPPAACVPLFSDPGCTGDDQ